MENIYQRANESKVTFNVPKGEALHVVWSSLWEQCEAANEKLQAHGRCFPKSSAKSLSNILKMLTVFQNEVKGREGREGDPKSSVLLVPGDDRCEKCGLSLSKQKTLEDNYERRGKMVEYLLSESGLQSIEAKAKHPTYKTYVYNEDHEEPGRSHVPQSTTFTQKTYSPEREIRENPTNALVQLLPNFTKYDPNKDPFTNMSLFEDECTQHNMGPRESCLMMKLWLPSQMSVRLASPVARPAGGPQFWSSECNWGDRHDRLKALAFLVTGEEDFGIDVLEDLKVTPQDDPWEFSRKFEQAYRLVMGVKDSSLPQAMLKALVNKFTYLDCATRLAASKERTVEGVVKIVDKYRRNPGGLMMDHLCPRPYQGLMTEPEKPLRPWGRPPQDNWEEARVQTRQPQYISEESNEPSDGGQRLYNPQEEASVRQLLNSDPKYQVFQRSFLTKPEGMSCK